MEAMADALEASGTEVVTVAVRRVKINETTSLLDFIDTKKYVILPNTAGCYSADEAIRVARLAREVGMSDMVKLEVLADERTLLPDPIETLKATQTLVKKASPCWCTPLTTRLLQEDWRMQALPALCLPVHRSVQAKGS